MLKGLGIFFTVLLLVGILHWASLRFVRTSRVRAKNLRTIFWYFYGTFFLAFGLVRFNDADPSKPIAVIQATIGLVVLVLVSTGKIEERGKG